VNVQLRRVFRLEDVAWFDALPYDVGDVVKILPPWLDLGDEAQLLSLDSDSANWQVSQSTIHDETSEIYEGSGSMKIKAKTSGLTPNAQTNAGHLKTHNLTGRSISFACFIPTGDLALIKNIRLGLGSGALEWSEWNIDDTDLVENEWQKLIYDLAAATDREGTSPVDLTTVNTLWFTYELYATDDATTYILVDDVRIVDSYTTCRITSMAKALQAHTWTITAVEVLEEGLRT